MTLQWEYANNLGLSNALSRAPLLVRLAISCDILDISTFNLLQGGPAEGVLLPQLQTLEFGEPDNPCEVAHSWTADSSLVQMVNSRLPSIHSPTRNILDEPLATKALTTLRVCKKWIVDPDTINVLQSLTAHGLVFEIGKSGAVAIKQ
jgi:hypothetical protein